MPSLSYPNPGTYSFNPLDHGLPDNYEVTVEVWGGGGGGCSGSAVLGSETSGGAGGGGGYAAKTFNLASGDYDVVVGAKGLISVPGTAGGESYFDDSTTVRAAGGSGGGVSSANRTPGGAGGTGTHGDTLYTGGAGGDGASGATTGGGGGGSSAGTASNGNDGGDGISPSNVGGSGGAAPTGGWAGGDGQKTLTAADTHAAGGGGGTGTVGYTGGGAGSVGKVVISWTALDPEKELVAEDDDAVVHSYTLAKAMALAAVDATHFLLVNSGPSAYCDLTVVEVDGSNAVSVTDGPEVISIPIVSSALVEIATGYFLLVWEGAGNDGYAQVISVNTSTYEIAAVGSALEYDTTNGAQPAVAVIDSEHVLVTYSGSGADGYAQVLEIDTDTWAVSKVGTAVEFDTVQCYYSNLYRINDDDTRYLVVHNGALSDGFARVLTVNKSTWAVTLTSSLEFDTSNAHYVDVVPLDSTHFLVLFYGGLYLGDYAEVLAVNTSTWAVTSAGTRYDMGNSTPYTYRSACMVEEADDGYYVVLAGQGGDGASPGELSVFKVGDTRWNVYEVGARLGFGENSAVEPYAIAIGGGKLLLVWGDTTNGATARVFSTGAELLTALFTVMAEHLLADEAEHATPSEILAGLLSLVGVPSEHMVFIEATDTIPSEHCSDLLSALRIIPSEVVATRQSEHTVPSELLAALAGQFKVPSEVLAGEVHEVVVPSEVVASAAKEVGVPSELLLAVESGHTIPSELLQGLAPAVLKIASEHLQGVSVDHTIWVVFEQLPQGLYRIAFVTLFGEYRTEGNALLPDSRIDPVDLGGNADTGVTLAGDDRPFFVTLGEL